MLTDRLTGYFNSKTRARGREYAQWGRVTLLQESTPEEYWAVVEGSDSYDVTIEVERGRSRWDVYVDCTCPYADSHGDYCKHIWATLLKLDKRRENAAVPRMVHLHTVGEEYEEFPDEPPAPASKLKFLDMLPESLRQSLAQSGFIDPLPTIGRAPLRLSSTQPTARKPKPQPRPVEPAWSKLLNNLSKRSMLHDPPRSVAKPIPELIYVLSFEHSYQRRKLILGFGRESPNHWRGYSQVSIGPEDIGRLQQEVDRRICLTVVGMGTPQYDYNGKSRGQWIIDAGTRESLLPMLFETGRVFYESQVGTGLERLTWDTGAPYQFALALTPMAKKAAYRLEGVLCRGDERRKVSDFREFLPGDPALVLHHGKLFRAELFGCDDWVSELGKRSDVIVADGDRRSFLSALARLQPLPPVDWPNSWNIATIDGVEPKPRLELTINEPDGRTGKPAKWVQGAVKFVYNDVEVTRMQTGPVVLDAERERQVRRRIETENRFAARVMELGMTPVHADGLRLPQKQLPGFVAALLDEGWEVLGNRVLFRTAGEFKLDVSTGIDWFDLHGHMEFEGQRVALPALLEAARKGERFVPLGDGSMGLLPEEWLRKHEGLFGLGDVEDDALRFRKTQVAVVDLLLSQLPEARFDEQLAVARRKFREFSGINARTPSCDFQGVLRGYQELGLGWLHFLEDFGFNGCLADDMGLGKTVQVLAFLVDRKARGVAGPSLAVMPKSLIFNWMRESARFAPTLRVLDYTGLEREQTQEEISRADLVLTTYGTLRRDIETLREYEFDYVMLDEAQNAKNPASLNAKCARLLRAKHRLALTGTPVENHVGDLWSLFEFLNPGMLGKQTAFNAAFRGPKNGSPNHDRTELLHRMLRPFILRRTKEQVAPELPERSEQVIECEMPPKQAEYYNELRDYYRKSLMGRVDKQGLNKSKVQILEALLRLRQAACHPALIDPKKANLESAKLDTLFSKLDELIDEGHKALVFSQFTSFLSIVRKHLDKQRIPYEYLDGQTSRRDECVDRFQNNGECPLFLISLKAGGVGLNLTAADYVFILDPWWNPAVEAQAIDRTHRIGQDKKVIAYRLITRNTVEAKIVELQQRKRDLAGAIITQANSMLQDLTKEDLALLLS